MSPQSTTTTPARAPGWELVLHAFLSAPDRTLTNVQLGQIRGVQAFHQRRSDLVRRGFVFTEAVRVAHGCFAYRLLGYRPDTPAAETLAEMPPSVSALPSALVALPTAEAVARAVEQGTRALKVSPPKVSDAAPSVAAEVIGAQHGEVERLRARVHELEQERLDREDGKLPVYNGALFVVFDGEGEGPTWPGGFVECETATGGGVRVPHKVDAVSGRVLFGPLYLEPQAAPRSARQPRAERGPTGPQIMRTVLEEAGVPLHSKVIAERVLAHGGDALYKGKTPDATMAAQLATSNKQGGEFVKVSPGCFALREWPAAKLEAEPVRS